MNVNTRVLSRKKRGGAGISLVDIDLEFFDPVPELVQSYPQFPGGFRLVERVGLEGFLDQVFFQVPHPGGLGISRAGG